MGMSYGAGRGSGEADVSCEAVPGPHLDHTEHPCRAVTPTPQRGGKSLPQTPAPSKAQDQAGSATSNHLQRRGESFLRWSKRGMVCKAQN